MLAQFVQIQKMQTWAVQESNLVVVAVVAVEIVQIQKMQISVPWAAASSRI